MSFALALRYAAWTAAVALAVLGPSLGGSFWGRLDNVVALVARHRTATWISLGLLALVVRAALLPFWPIPKPVIYDEFAYILQADTFASGRLTNPTHKLWPFFESPYELQQPTYAAKYPPGQALFMAAGQAVFGDPWFGVWLSCGAMLAALVWALQAWLPARWALVCGILALPLAVSSYWMNSYWGGAVAGIGGALLLGGYARVVKRKQVAYAVAMGTGIAILANTRPYEGLVFTIPVAVAFLLSRPRWGAVGLISVTLIPAFALTGIYNRAVTGSAWQMPFTEYGRQFARIPIFNFQPLQPSKVYATPIMLDLHENWERKQWATARTWQLLELRFKDWRDVASVLLGSILLGILIVAFIPNLWRDRRIRLPLFCVLAALGGSFLEIVMYPHYSGPVTVALFIVATQALRHLSHWESARGHTGRFLARVAPLLIVGAAIASQGMVLVRQEPPESRQPVNALRDQVAAKLEEADPLSRHVIVVRYTRSQSPHEEWVYNSANIDQQEVIWAHDLGPAQNRRLLEYYKDRKFWLLQPDNHSTELEAYK